MGKPKNDRKRPHAEAEDLDPASFEDRDNGAVQSSKRARVEERRSLFVRSLPPSATSETLTDFFSQHYPVKHAIVVVDQKTKESRGYGFVTFADADDATEAKKALHNQEWDGRRLRIDIAEPRHRNAANGEVSANKARKEELQKPPKLIIRNLPWSIKTSEQLSNLFRSFGKIKFADLPQSKGKLKGFGFVTIRGKKNAEKALEAINGKEIDGRTLAVDWAVDKETWAQQQPAEEESDNKEEEEKDEEDDEDEAESADEDEDEDGGAKTENRDDQLNADLENFFKNHMENLEEEDSEEDEDEDEEDDLEEEDDSEKAPKRTTDNTSTLFIRNLPFTTTDEQLKGFFGHFGKVRYARVVMDKVTEKPAGTGFVCFFDVEDAKNCIKGAPRPTKAVTANKNSILQDESADPDGKYTLDGRLLQVAQAVNKEEASTLADSALAKRNQKDKRRLFLLTEGNIDRNSSIFNLLTEPEIRMRQASAAQRKKLVQGNPSLHISLTRLALRNIPRNIGSKELKELARKAVVEFAKDVKAGRRQPLSKEENARDGKDAKEKEQQRKAKGKGIVRQAKVVFESAQGQKLQEKEGGKSRGYGFIEYHSHHWALMGLRYLNGLQLENDAGKKQRLVVEFAIENAQVVQRRRANEERSKQMQPDQAKPAKTQSVPRENARFSRDKGKPRGRKGGKPAEADAAEEGSGKPNAKEDMKQKLIARKRLMRKKKAQIRGKK
ncbi:RNA recognition motif-containing protein [Fusarium solani]|nr:RNA recognition motif-containing protein [Fusarium solani]